MTVADAPPSVEVPEMSHELGILFVPGFSSRAPGETLAARADAIAAWVRRWIDGVSLSWAAAGATLGDVHAWLDGVAGDEELSIADTVVPKQELEALSKVFEVPAARLELLALLTTLREEIHQPKKRSLEGRDLRARPGAKALCYLGGRARLRRCCPEGPPNVSLESAVVDRDGFIHCSTWLMAESYWPESFPPPRRRELVAWTVLVAPWVVANLLARRAARAWRAERDTWAARGMAIARGLLFLPVALMGLPLTVGLQVTLALLLLPAAIPLGFLRQHAEAVQRRVASELGDSFAFAHSPLRTAHAVARVKADLEWLATRVERVVVVAESQGVAVVERALREFRPENLRMAVTVGSALKRLVMLSALRATGMNSAKACVAVGLVASLSAVQLVGTSLLGIGPTSVPEMGLSLFGLVFLAVLWLALGEEKEPSVHCGLAGLRWLDYFASADPVADGPSLQALPPTKYQSIEVHNRDSLLRDHAGYWANTDEFLAHLVCAISREAESAVPLHSLTEYDEWTLANAAARRSWRVRHLRWLRWTTVIAGGAMIWVLASDLAALGNWLESASQRIIVLPGWISTLALSLSVTPEGLLGAIGIAIGTWLAGLVVMLAWKLWDQVDLWCFFQRIPPHFEMTRGTPLAFYLHNAGFFVFAATFGAFLFAAAYVVFLWPQDLPRWAVLAGIAVAGTIFGVAAMLSARSGEPARPPSGRLSD